MKITSQIIILATALCVFACSKNSNVSPKESMISTITSSEWVAENVVNETDGDLTSLYKNFSVTFRKNSSSNFMGEYYVANGSYAFPNGYGQWTISEDLKTMTFNNGQSIAIALTNKKLTMDFIIAPSTGRVSGVAGHFTFTLKQL